MRVRITIFVLKKQEVLHTPSSCLSFQLSNIQTHLPYFIVICGLSVSIIFIQIISGKCNFRTNVIEYKLCVLTLFTTFSETFLILGGIQRDTIRYDTIRYDINVQSFHVKYPVISLDFNKTCILSTDFRKIFQYQMLLPSFQCKPNCLMRTDRRMERQIDMTKLIVGFRNFAKVTNNRENRKENR